MHSSYKLLEIDDPGRLDHIKDPEMKEICEKYLKGKRFLKTKSARKIE